MSSWFRWSRWSRWNGVALALVASIVAPITFLSAVLISEVDPMMILFVRSLQHVVLFLVLFLVGNGASLSSIFVKREMLYLIGSAFSQTISMSSFYYAQTKLAAADVSAIRFSSPLFATLGGYLFLGEKFGLVQGLGAIVVVVGAVFITKPTWLFGQVGANSAEDVIGGTTLSVVSCLFMASQTLFTRKLRRIETSVVVLVDFLVCSLANLALLFFYDDFRYPRCGWSVALCLLGGVTAMLANALTVHAGKLLKAGHLSVIRTSSIFFTYVFQIWLLGLVPTWHSVVGAFFILLSLVGTTLKRENRDNRDEKSEKTPILGDSTSN